MTQPEDIACRELVELVTDYLEGALAEARRLAVDAHLAGCPGCAAYVEQMRQTIRAAGRVEPEQLTPAQRRALLDLFGTLRK
jgi:anti-sigma factor RsiW